MLNLNDTIYTNQTGKFRVRSIRGYNCTPFTCSYNANTILVYPLKTKAGSEIVNIIDTIHNYLTEQGCNAESSNPRQ